MHFRGAMGAMMQFMLTIGILFVNALGIENAVDWSIITVLCIIPAGKYALIPFILQQLTVIFETVQIFIFLLELLDLLN